MSICHVLLFKKKRLERIFVSLPSGLAIGDSRFRVESLALKVHSTLGGQKRHAASLFCLSGSVGAVHLLERFDTVIW
jgi:hypothetical protein